MADLSLIISGYTHDESPTGIYFAQLNTQHHQFTLHPSNIDLKHPSYFDYANQQLTVISEVLETQSPTICQYRLDNWQVTPQTQSPLSGSAPCYVEASLSTNMIATAQYGSGHIDIFSCTDDGIIDQHRQTIDSQAFATSDEQESHAHQAVLLPISQTLVTVDLGCDCLRVFPFDHHHHTVAITDSYSVALPIESGPRHVIFDKNEQFGVVLCEISEQLILLKKIAGKWQIHGHQAALPQTENGQAAGAIKFSPDERFIYLTGRRQNLIACFAFNGLTGECEYQYAIDCGGRFARDFAISHCGNWLVVANQLSHNLALFRRDNETGELQDTKIRHKVPSPTCIKFI